MERETFLAILCKSQLDPTYLKTDICLYLSVMRLNKFPFLLKPVQVEFLSLATERVLRNMKESVTLLTAPASILLTILSLLTGTLEHRKKLGFRGWFWIPTQSVTIYMILDKTYNVYEPQYEPQIWGYCRIYRLFWELKLRFVCKAVRVWHLVFNKWERYSCPLSWQDTK